MCRVTFAVSNGFDLPMGDGNATCFAELGHLGVLDAGNALMKVAFVSYHSPPPKSDLWQFVMIDDHILVQATAS